MRVQSDLRLPQSYDASSLANVLRTIVTQLNNLSEGRLTARDTGNVAAPTTGSAAQGDIVFNSTPTELGSGGSKYVVLGWICVADGSPGTWQPMRVLTGN